jgi:hypothetical protein
MRRVVLHIDRLVLKGFEPGDRDRIAADLQGELGRLLADPATAGRLATLGHMPTMRSGPQSSAEGAKPQRSGISAAGAITRGLLR